MQEEYLLLALGALCLWVATGVFYRLYLHPLAKFPGPKLAAVSTLYEAYYDVLRKGRYIFKVGELHKKYGPIVRIGPNELHIRDSAYYGTLYNMSNRLDKPPYFYSMLGNPDALFGTIRSGPAKLRRASVAPYFTSQAMAKFYPSMQANTNKMVKRIEEAAQRGEIVPLSYAYRAMTVDIIAQYTFGHPLGILERKDWGEEFYWAWYSLWELSPTIRQLPFLFPLMMSAPRQLTKLLNPSALEVVDLFSSIDTQTKMALSSEPSETGKQGHSNIVWNLAHNDLLPPVEKTFERLAEEANGLVAAGFETTGSVLTHATFHILSNEGVRERLVKVLEEEIPDLDDIPNFTVLEKIPYLFAVVKETLRLAIGAFSRLPRVVGPNPIRYKDWVVPPGTSIGMSALYVHHDPSIFPDPLAFKPERWLSTSNPPTLDPNNLERHLHTFGKGPRGCVGTNLAYAELYSVLATVFRRFGRNLELWNTTENDMKANHDYFGGMVSRGKALRVKVRKEVR